MRLLKRLVVVFIVSLIAFCFFHNCSPAPDIYTDYSLTDIDEVSFVRVDQDGEVNILETMSPDSLPEFMEEFSQIPFGNYWNDPPNFILGSTIKFTLTDGSYYLTNHYCTAFFKDGSVEYNSQYYDYDAFETVWCSYCEFDYAHQ